MSYYNNLNITELSQQISGTTNRASTHSLDGKIDESISAEGRSVPMEDTSGNKLEGLIIEVGKDNLRIDFNHLLAGKKLWFKGAVLNIEA